VDIEVVTRRGCSACEKTKQILRNFNVDFRETIIEETVTRDEIVNRFPDRRKLPIILVNSAVVEGPTELQLLLESGNLQYVRG
jgi:glutaredoxin